MTWQDYLSQPRIRLRTAAPADAPEVKGSSCYFQPEWLDWSICTDGISVSASGPATRTKYKQGAKYWNVEGNRAPDERPAWLLLPNHVLAIARLAIEDVARALREERS